MKLLIKLKFVINEQDFNVPIYIFSIRAKQKLWFSSALQQGSQDHITEEFSIKSYQV